MPDLSTIRFSFRHRTALEVLGDCVVLFSEEQQQLHRFNDSSAVLALRLRDGASFAELGDELRSHDVDPGEIEGWVGDFLQQLAGLGLLAADWAASSQPARRVHYAIAGVELAVDFETDALLEAIAPPLAHLAVRGSGGAHSMFRVGAAGDFLLIASDGAPAIVADRAFAAVLFKGMVLEHVLASAGHLCALHAACLVGDHGAILLLGAPGAGKTTLTLALVAQGLRYASDDVALVLPGGTVRGVPLAPGVKAGAWGMVAGLDDQPVHLRPDAQQVRFAPLTGFVGADAHRVAMIINLRRAGGAPAALAPIAPSAGLVELFRESRSPSGACTTEIIEALTAMVGDADCFDLHYGDAADAVPLLLERDRRG